MNDKNLLLIVDRIEDGGAEKALVRLGEDLLPFFDNVYITSNYKTKKNIAKLKLLEVNIEPRLGLMSKIYTLIKFFIHIQRVKREKKITHSISFLERSNIANCVTSSNDIRIISTRNNLQEQYRPLNHLVRFGVRFAISLAYLNANKVVALSKNISEQLEGFLFFPKDVITIYNGYNIQKQLATAQKYANRIKFEKDKINVIAVGRLAEQKGLDILIEAMRYFRAKNVQLRIFGEGPDKKKYEDLINKFALNDCISLCKPTNEILGYVQRSDIFVFSSRWEGFGNALAEAVILKKVIVTSDCAYGPSEILGYEYGTTTIKVVNSAVVYRDPMSDKDKVNSLTLALEYALQNFQQLTNQSSNHSIRFDECFSHKKVVNKWLNILKVDPKL